MVVHHVVQRAGRDVRKRQKGDAGVSGIEVEIHAANVLVGGDVAMSQCDSLGLAGGPRGVDQGGQVLGFHGAHQCVEHRVALTAAVIGSSHQRTKRNGPLRRILRFRPWGIHDHDPFQHRLAADGVQLVELLAGGDHGNPAAGIPHQPCNLLTGERGINGHIDCANGQRGEVGDGPLPAVLGDQGDAVALLCAPTEKNFAQGSDALVDLV